jgi:hypothetical protein
MVPRNSACHHKDRLVDFSAPDLVEVLFGSPLGALPSSFDIAVEFDGERHDKQREAGELPRFRALFYRPTTFFCGR